MLIRGAVLAGFLAATVWAAFWAGRPSEQRGAARRWLGALLVLAGAAAGAAAVQGFYLEPRYSGVIGFLTEGLAAGSAMKETEAQRGMLAAHLSIYFSDRGAYPDRLETLWQDKKYLDGPPRPVEVYLGNNGAFRRAHWYRDASRIKAFSSRAQSDDAGGWGYVADRASPEWGTVFVNCTHLRLNGGPWNMAFDAAPQAAADPPLE